MVMTKMMMKMNEPPLSSTVQDHKTAEVSDTSDPFTTLLFAHNTFTLNTRGGLMAPRTSHSKHSTRLDTQGRLCSEKSRTTADSNQLRSHFTERQRQWRACESAIWFKLRNLCLHHPPETNHVLFMHSPPPHTYAMSHDPCLQLKEIPHAAEPKVLGARTTAALQPHASTTDSPRLHVPANTSD